MVGRSGISSSGGFAFTDKVPIPPLIFVQVRPARKSSAWRIEAS